MSVEVVKVVANGREDQVELPCTVGMFLKKYGWRPTQVVVELNGRVLERSEVDKVALSGSDRLEVVVPVAGG